MAAFLKVLSLHFSLHLPLIFTPLQGPSQLVLGKSPLGWASQSKKKLSEKGGAKKVCVAVGDYLFVARRDRSCVIFQIFLTPDPRSFKIGGGWKKTGARFMRKV